MITNLVERAKVLATAFVTYAVVAATVLSAALVAAEPFKDVQYVGVAVQYGGVALAALASAISIVRRVTVVPAELRGVLVPSDPDLYDQVDDLDHPDDEFWGQAA